MLHLLYMGVNQTSRKVGTFAKINNLSKVFLEMYCYSCCQSLHCLTEIIVTIDSVIQW